MNRHLREDPVEWAKSQEATYLDGEDRPLFPFVGIIGANLAMVGALGLAVKASGKELPERLGIADLALLSVATHKLSRVLTKSPVTSPIRAPFTRFQGKGGEAELAEEVRGGGTRKAVGELITCPFCLGEWIATLLTFGLVLAPRPTRLIASIFVTLTGSDLLQLAYAKCQSVVE